jgi:hypothetical protein
MKSTDPSSLVVRIVRKRGDRSHWSAMFFNLMIKGNGEDVYSHTGFRPCRSRKLFSPAGNQSATSDQLVSTRLARTVFELPCIPALRSQPLSGPIESP